MNLVKRFLENLLEEFLKNKKRSTSVPWCEEMFRWGTYDSYPNFGPCTLANITQGDDDWCPQIIEINENEYEINILFDRNIPPFGIDSGQKFTLNFYDDKNIGFCKTYPPKCKNVAPIYIRIKDNSELIINTVGSEMPRVSGKPLINYIGGASNNLYCSDDAARNYKVSINYNWTPPTP